MTDCSVERKILIRKKRNELCSYSVFKSGYKVGNLRKKIRDNLYKIDIWKKIYGVEISYSHTTA